MNIFNKVTLKSLRKNRTRTIVTIIGIVLSTAMICAVTTSVSSLMNYFHLNYEYKYGSWHGQTLGANFETLNKIKTDDEVQTTVYSQNIGYAEAEGSKNEDKPYLYVIGASKGFEDVMPVHLISGKYPSSSNEILVPSHLSENGGISYKIGDTITLDIGDRMSDGYALTQENPYYNYDENGYSVLSDEKFVQRETRTYTVSGYYERPNFENYYAPGYTLLTLSDTKPAENTTYDIFFKMKEPKNIYSYMDENNLGLSTNRDVLMFSGVSRYDSFYTVLYGLAAIIIALIMFGSVSLIYNAFAISVSERTKQFGLLSSIGATKKQLRKTVLFEALTVSTIGIPLGILVGVGGIGITLLIIGDGFSSLSGYDLPMHICVSTASIVIAVVIGLLTVLISAWIPSKRATKISAVEAIRQTTDISVKAKPVKVSKLTVKLFGLSGMLAGKYFKRSRKKYRATIVSLFMSVVLFVSASAFTSYLTESVEGSFSTYGFDILYTVSRNETEVSSLELLYKQLKNVTNVEKSAFSQVLSAPVSIKKTDLTEKFFNNYINEQRLGGVEIDDNVNSLDVMAVMNFVSDDEFKELLHELDLDEQEYMSSENPKAVVVDGNRSFSSQTKKFEVKKVLKSSSLQCTTGVLKQLDGYDYTGDYYYDDEACRVYTYQKNDNPDDKIEVLETEAMSEQKLSIGKVITEKPFFLEEDGDIMLIYPNSLRTSVCGPYIDMNADTNFLFTSSNHISSCNAMRTILTSNGMSTKELIDYAERADQDRNLITIVNVFAYGFIVLISLIAVANVFNTVSTNISLRRREFAMLKSIGMTKSGFNKMMNYECLLYGARALLYGLPVSVIVTYFIYRAIDEGYSTGFHLPWIAIGIAVLSVFAVVFATMMYSMNKIKKDNPIDALKNENI